MTQGSEDLLVASCKFERLDGNALMLSSYNRNATVQKREFACNITSKTIENHKMIPWFTRSAQATRRCL